MSVVWDFGDGEVRPGPLTETHVYDNAVGSPFVVRATPDLTGASGWVTHDLAVPSRVVPWADIYMVTGTNSVDWSATAGHGNGSMILVALTHGDPPLEALAGWVPEGTVRFDVLCSDPAWPHPTMLPLAILPGQPVILSFNDPTLGLQAGAPKDVEMSIVGLDASDVEIWRKTAPFHVDLVAAADDATADAEDFDPGDYTVNEVIAYVEEHPDEAQAVYDAENAGKARVTLLTDLESRLA